MNEPLTGDELLRRVKELSHLPKTELARACGYVSRQTYGRSGKSQTNFTAFCEALLRAKGFDINNPDPSRPKRKPPLRVRVRSSGVLAIGPSHLADMGIQPGQEFEVQPITGGFRLVRVEPAKAREEKPKAIDHPSIVSVIPKGSVA